MFSNISKDEQCVKQVETPASHGKHEERPSPSTTDVQNDHANKRDNKTVGFSDHKSTLSGSNKMRRLHSSFLSFRSPNRFNSQVPFLNVVHKTVSENKNGLFATWYNDRGKPTDKYTYGELWHDAGVISHYLRREWNIEKGQRVILCYDFGLHFFASFLGCLRAGVTPVLVYPPGPPLTKSLTKMTKVVEDCQPQLIMTDSNVNLLRLTDGLNPLSRSRNLWPRDVKYKVTDNLVGGRGIISKMTDKAMGRHVVPFDEMELCPDDIAFLQYTSGSTGDPKGVMVTLGALGANVDLLHHGFINCYKEDGGVPDKIVGFSWLPQYHDLGLIYAAITPFAGGWEMHMMSPVTFVKHPLLWLELMSRHKVSWAMAPDFGYRLVARKFIEAKERAGGKCPIPELDLSCIQSLHNASEPVRISTRDKFREIFSKYNLSENWFMSGYGLAETVVGVSWLNEFKTSTPRPEDRSPFIANGARKNFAPGLVVKIVDPGTRKEVDDETTGEVWIAGRSVALGYYNRPQQSQETFRATLENDPSETTYLRTGDLGFFQDGYFYICGRIKDLIIHSGVNYYPQDIEFAAQDASTAVRPGCVAAFSRDETGDDGVIEVVFEVRKDSEPDAEKICEAVRSAVTNDVGVPPDRVVAIKERTIPKTTSGKIQRSACRSRLHNGACHVVFDLQDSKHSSSLVVSDKDDIVSTDTSKVDSSNETEIDEADSIDAFDEIMYGKFGDSYSADESWEQLGLSSMVSVELRDTIRDSYSVTLSPDCFRLHTTPALLKSHILEIQGNNFPIKLPDLPKDNSTKVSWTIMGVVQALGSAMLLLMFAAPIIPAYHVGKGIASNDGVMDDVEVNGHSVRWMWLPFVLPVWMMGFSLMVIVMKWVVVGRHRSCEMQTPSISYIRWWWVDRAVHLWETWVGIFVVDTPLLWLFYRLMGAKIHPSAQLDAFIREFDLVEIGRGASIEFQIRCRKFVSWEEDEEGPTLRFRPICISKRAVVKGMVSPGASLGEGAYVEKLSVVSEGAQVPAGVKAVGNPAFDAALMPRRKSWCWWKLGIMKLMWLVVQLYLFVACLFVGESFLRDLLLYGWRYSTLLFWCLIIGWTSVLSLALNICLKWVMIGRRKAGSRDTLIRTAIGWMVDYHFSISILTLFPLTFNSRVWNLVLKLYGMDIDFASKIYVDNFPPSNIDMISLRGSFVGTVDFETKLDGCFQRTEIEASSVSLFAIVGPNVTISKSVIPPITYVSESSKVIGEDADERATTPKLWKLISVEVAVAFVYLGQVLLVLISLIPGYELWTSVFKPTSVEAAVPVLALLLFVQTIVWILLLLCFRTVAYGGSNKRTEPWSNSLYAVYLSMSYGVQELSFLSTLWGTPLFNFVLRFLGSNVKGRVLFFGRRFYDLPYLSFDDRTLVDGGIIGGHQNVYYETELGPNKLSGILHDGSCAFSNATVTKKETGPWRAIVGGTPEAGADV